MNPNFTNEQLYPTQVKHRTGNVYRCDSSGHFNGNWYLLAHCGASRVCLIGLDFIGNFWRMPRYTSNLHDISQEDFKMICDGYIFTYVGRMCELIKSVYEETEK
jgi:hypothetical protein